MMCSPKRIKLKGHLRISLLGAFIPCMEAQLMALEGADPLPVRSASKKEGDSHVTPPLCDMLQSSQV